VHLVEAHLVSGALLIFLLIRRESYYSKQLQWEQQGFYFSLRLQCSGVVVPMIDDGYGFFYRINEEEVVYALTSWKYSTVTDPKNFREHLAAAFRDVLVMYENLPGLTSAL